MGPRLGANPRKEVKPRVGGTPRIVFHEEGRGQGDRRHGDWVARLRGGPSRHLDERGRDARTFLFGSSGRS